MSLRTMKRILLAVAVALVAITATVGQNYSIESYVIAGGGGTSSGGDFTLSGTVGQPSAGIPLSGGTYTLQGGFWPGLIVTTSGEVPQLFIQMTAQDVTVSWAPATSGFVLEQSEDLGNGTWLPAPEGNPVLVPATDSAVFYRLRKD
jgi:hypothetical protein